MSLLRGRITAGNSGIMPNFELIFYKKERGREKSPKLLVVFRIND